MTNITTKETVLSDVSDIFIWKQMTTVNTAHFLIIGAAVSTYKEFAFSGAISVTINDAQVSVWNGHSTWDMAAAYSLQNYYYLQF